MIVKIPKMQGRFRWKAILLLVAGFALFAALWFFLHKHQIASIHSRFMEQAARAEESGNPERAARFLKQYLLVKRDDVDAQARYGILTEQSAQNPYALEKVLKVYEQVLEQAGASPDIGMDAAKLEDVRLRAAKLSVNLYGPRGVDKSLEHLSVLEKAGSSNPEVDVLSGECKLRKKEWEKNKLDKIKQDKLVQEAKKHFQKAIDRAPDKLEAYSRLALLLRNDQHYLEATEVLDKLIKINPQQYKAYLIRATFRQGDRVELLAWGTRILGLAGSPLGQGQVHASWALFLPRSDLKGAGDDLAQARRLAPDNVDVLLASAFQERLLAVEKGQTKADSAHLAEARVYLQRADQLSSKDARIQDGLTKLELATAQRSDEALEILRNAEKKATGAARKYLLWDLADLLIKNQQLIEAKEKIAQMREAGVPAYHLDLLRAKILIEQGQWYKAADMLVAARPLLVDFPARVMQADLLLGACFERLGNAEQQLAVYLHARRLDPLKVEARLGQVNALLALNRLDEAIEECENLTHFQQAAAEATLRYARLLIFKNVSLPLARGRWDDVIARLQTIRKDNPKRTLEIDVALAEVEVVRGNYEAAQKILEGAKEAAQEVQAPSLRVQPWIALAGLAARRGDEKGNAEALQILEGAKAKWDDLPELRLAALRHVPSKKEAALALLETLGAGLGLFDRSSRGRLLAGLAEAFYDAGNPAKAEKLWLELAELEPNQLQVPLGLFDFYSRTDNRAGVDRALKSIQDIEGPNGPVWNFGQAQTLILRAGSEDKKMLAKAREHLLAAAAKRPSWSRIPEALASIAELEGNSELAIAHLRDAVNLGSRNLPIVRALVAKLMESRRFDEADDVIRKLQGSATNEIRHLQKVAAEVSIFSQHPERALELAGNAVSDDSKDYKDHLWKGQMLGAARDFARAKASLRRATELAGGVPDPWVALVQLQAAEGAPTDAKATIELMKAKVTPSQLPFALARCYQAIGDHAMAEKAFHAALSAQPNNLFIVHSVAKFHLAGDNGPKIEPYLRAMIDPNRKWVGFDGGQVKISEELVFWARRQLAMSLGFQGNADKQREAMNLVEQNINDKKPASMDDQIAKGMLMTVRAEERPEAINVLVKAFKVKQPTIDQMFFLASLYETEWNWPKARAYLVDLLSTYAKHQKYHEYLAAFVGKLVFHGDLDEAPVWLRNLQEIDPHSFRTLSCLVRYNAKCGNTSEILRPIKNYLDSKEAKTPDPASVRLARAASLLGDVARLHPEVMPKSNMQESESLLRSFAGQIGTKESLLPVANFLANCQRLQESLDLCEKLLKDLPVEQVVLTAVTAVAISNNPGAKQIERVEAWLKFGQQQNPKAVEWDGLLAALKERQGKVAEAADLYRKILKQKPQDPVALNNLAFLLGLQGKGDEAFFWIQKLDGSANLNGEVLDTKAVILRAQGKLRDAEKNLKEALRQQRTPYRLFHLAQLYQSAKDHKKTIEVFKQAWDMGLRSEMVHPLERASFQDIFREWEQSK